MIFVYKDWAFELSIPEYDTATFGHQVGELRLLPLPKQTDNMGMDCLIAYLKKNNIRICTFRGEEDTVLVRYLASLGFNFVGTYSDVICKRKDFSDIPIKSDVSIEKADAKDFGEMMDIKARVFDYSTYQLDPALVLGITTRRNVLRLKSYFSNPLHCSYVCKVSGRVVGYIQFLIDLDNRIAYTENGAIDPDYQNMFIGAKLYSDAFKRVFDMGVRSITSGYCNQNTPVVKIHQAIGFKVRKHEIHLRIKI